MQPSRNALKKSGSHIDKRLEDDALFREIGGQLDASNFDYSQWQRDGNEGTLKDGRSKRGQFMVSSGPGARKDSGCQHGKAKEKRQNVISAYEAALAKKKAEQIKILQLRIQARRQTMDEYRKRQAELLLSNMELKDEIMKLEKEAHEEVKKLLHKYEKYRGGINTLNDRFVGDLSGAKNSFEETKTMVDTELAALNEKVTEMDEQLKEKQDHLHVLVHYKDKEYPVKSLKISELQTELMEMKVSHEEEETELTHIIDTELDKLHKEENDVRQKVTAKATEDIITEMHPSLRDMATQNLVMAKEAAFHTSEITSVQAQTQALVAEVARLRADPRTSVRRQVYPEFYPNQQKCTPDMEVVLDIPTQKWLPI